MGAVIEVGSEGGLAICGNRKEGKIPYMTFLGSEGHVKDSDPVVMVRGKFVEGYVDEDKK